MGRVIRLDTKFTGNNMPRLVDYEFASIQAEILAWPTLRAFYDAGNVVVSGSSVTRLNDLSGAGRHFNQANTALSPTVSTINGQPGIYFDGSKEMLSTGLFSGNNEQSVVGLLHASGATSASQIFLSKSDTSSQNFYLNQSAIQAFSGGAQLLIPGVKGKLINYIAAFNISKNTCTLYGNDSGNIGTRGSSTSPPSGNANLGRWSNDQNANKYIGHIGYLAVFDEDLGKNEYLRNLLNSYARSRWRTSTWTA